MPVTDEDIVRDLLHRYTDHVQPPDSIAAQVAARQHRRDRRRRVASLAATGAALATAASVIAVVPGHPSPTPGVVQPVTSTGSGIKLTAEQSALYKLSSAAASQHAGNGRFVVMMTQGQDIKDTSVIDSLNGDMWSYQKGTDGCPQERGSPGTIHRPPHSSVPCPRAWQPCASRSSRSGTRRTGRRQTR